MYFTDSHFDAERTYTTFDLLTFKTKKYSDESTSTTN